MAVGDAVAVIGGPNGNTLKGFHNKAQGREQSERTLGLRPNLLRKP